MKSAKEKPESDVHVVPLHDATLCRRACRAVGVRGTDLPFHTDDVDCKGYWLKPDAHTYKQRVKNLRSQVNSALIALLTEVERVRPRIMVGEGQGGVIAAMHIFLTSWSEHAGREL